MSTERDIVVVLGMLTRIPVAGIVCLTMPYLVGLERLGYNVYYVEEHGASPSTFKRQGDGSIGAAAYLEAVMKWFGLGDRWSFHALHGDGRYYGLSERRVKKLYRDAALILNMHGGTRPQAEHCRNDRLVLLDTDPVGFQVAAVAGGEDWAHFAEAHSAFFTWGENLGNPDCGVPVPSGIDFRPTRMPVLLDLWQLSSVPPGPHFTTVGNWSQRGEDLIFEGEVYHWSKHYEFLKFLELPRLTDQSFELALSSYTPETRLLLEQHGWRVRHGLHVSASLNTYRRYVGESRAEFTVAKDQNIRLRSGWFSDRSAAYLAAGRPVVTQETGFSNVLPTGAGLFAFSTMDEIVAAVDEINAHYDRHARAAREIAREFFDAEVVLGRMLRELGLPSRPRPVPLRVPEAAAFPPDLNLEPLSRRPTTLSDATVAAIRERPLPFTLPALSDAPIETTIVVTTRDNLVLTRLCLESVLANTSLESDYELVVVDNGSGPETRDYLCSLVAVNAPVRLILNEENRGFPAASNQGLEAAAGRILVLLNNDTIVPPGWLNRLTGHLADPAIGLVGPLSNRAGTGAEVAADYRTYGELIRFAASREASTELQETGRLTLFCTALRRDVYERVGPLDEGFGPGMFEDDDYSLRVRAAGYRIAVARDVFVHHFGQATVGDPATVPDFGALFHENRRRFEEKWEARWAVPALDPDPTYARLVERVRGAVETIVPPGERVLVVSKGDDALLDLEGRTAEHFPQVDGGLYAGHHPADSSEAISQLESLMQCSGSRYLVFPRTSLWWLDHYAELRQYLDDRCRRALTDDDTVIYALEER